MPSAESHPPVSERSTAFGACPRCASGLLAALTICPRCGEAVPDNASSPRYLVLRGEPARPSARRETARLLADSETGPLPAEVERQLRDLPALFCAPLPDATIARLAERVRRSGYRVDVLGAFPEGLGFREHFEWVLARLSRVLPYLAGLSASVALFWNERYWLAQLVAGLVALFGFFDRRRFLKQATLRAPRLATRLDMAPAGVEDALGALLRDPVLSEPLRDALSSLLGEYGRLLDTLSPFTAQYPDLVRPTSRALAQLARHAAVTAERALAIEKAGDFTDPTLPDRLASLRPPWVAGDRAPRQPAPRLAPCAPGTARLAPRGPRNPPRPAGGRDGHDAERAPARARELSHQ